MTWDGVERRRNVPMAGVCSSHIELVSDMAVIKNSLKNIETTITQGVSFKTAVTSGFVGVGVLIAIQIIAFAFLFGQMSRQVTINTERVRIAEERLDRVRAEQKISEIR